MRVYIVQESGQDQIPDAKVFLTSISAIKRTQELIEYGGLKGEAGDEIDLSDWTGKWDVECWSDNGEMLVRLYSVDVLP